MTETQNFFFQLVQSGIGLYDLVDMRIQDSIHWSDVVSLAVSQRLEAVAFDGLQCSPSYVASLPKSVKMRWIGQCMAEEKRYAIQKNAERELAASLKKVGIHTYVLKGEVVSECYPKPEHRRSVDLDCWLGGPEDVWEKGNLLVEKLGYEVKRDYYKNSTWLLPGLTAENHRWLTPFRGNKRLMALEKLLQKLLREDSACDKFEETELLRPPVMVSALFLIEHAYSHFLHEGLNWRHILDWSMFSRKHHDDIDWQQFESWIDVFGFRRFYDSYVSLGRLIVGAITETDLTDLDKVMLADVWAPLDLHKTVRGFTGKLSLVGNTWRARWKYREFSDLSWLRALWIQAVGVVFDKNPSPFN